MESDRAQIEEVLSESLLGVAVVREFDGGGGADSALVGH
jgi:hypothetical protein